MAPHAFQNWDGPDLAFLKSLFMVMQAIPESKSEIADNWQELVENHFSPELKSTLLHWNILEMSDAAVDSIYAEISSAYKSLRGAKQQQLNLNDLKQQREFSYLYEHLILPLKMQKVRCLCPYDIALFCLKDSPEYKTFFESAGCADGLISRLADSVQRIRSSFVNISDSIFIVPSAANVLLRAKESALQRKQAQVMPLNCLEVLVSNRTGTVYSMLKKMNINIEALKSRITTSHQQRRGR